MYCKVMEDCYVILLMISHSLQHGMCIMYALCVQCVHRFIMYNFCTICTMHVIEPMSIHMSAIYDLVNID